MKTVIENTEYRAEIDSIGAELKSLVTKSNKREYIWSGDDRWWSGTAPILFPIVGGLKGGAYTYKGLSYELPQHGFARKSAFHPGKTQGTRAEFILRADEGSRAVYPFDFELSVTFVLDGAGLGVEYSVTNRGGTDMYFSIGSHPAIRLPFAGGTIENYYLYFNRPESLERHFFENGLCLEKTAPIFGSSRIISLTRNIFDNGPIILKGLRSDAVAVMNSRNTARVTITTDGAPYLGIWSKPSGAPFLCVEPWFGVPDSPGADGRLEHKEGIRRLDSGECYKTGYRIEVIP